MHDHPDKDGFWPLDQDASPCVGSGYCCKKAPCPLGVQLHGPIAPCPSLVEKDGRHWCGEILRAPPEEAARLRQDLYVGAGCCSPMNSDRQRVLLQIAKLSKNGF